MSDRIADLYILTLPAGMSARAFAARGTLDHLRPAFDRLAEIFGRVVIIHHGADDETTPEGVPMLAASDDLHDRICRTFPDARSAVIKTLQLCDAGVSIGLTESLRTQGWSVGLIARGGHLRSKFFARQLGPDAPEARQAGEDERRLCAEADLVIGTSGIMVDDLAWRWHLPRSKTRIIPNFIDESMQLGPVEHRDAGTILVVGPLEAYKRIDRVIDAMGALPEAQREAITIRIVGNGPQEQPLRAQAERLGVRSDFLGWLGHDALLAQMRSCALYVQVSAYEGHPRALIEAMGSGAAVMTADGWGVASQIDNGISGVVVPGSIDSITYAISGMLEDEAWREMLGQTAARIARRRYGLETVFKLKTEALRAAMDAGTIGHARDAA